MPSPKSREEISKETFNKIRPRPNSLVVATLLESLMNVWGGPDKFARSFHAQYMNATEGSGVRARLLGDIMRLFIAHTAIMKDHASTVEAMSEQELLAVIKDAVDVEGNGTTAGAGRMEETKSRGPGSASTSSEY